MTPLSPEQVAAVRELQALCKNLGVEVVIIGAIAYRIWMQDWSRHTEDVDAAVALDLDDFPRLTTLLQEHRWTQDLRREHRWNAAEGGRLDLLPAGPGLRQQQQLEWPISGMKMSLVGFEHVFSKAVEYRITSDLTAKVIPLPVLVLLKIVAYRDNPYQREKDIEDLGAIMTRYEPLEALRFSDEVLDLGLEYETVGAYWVGKDLGVLCSADERALVDGLLAELHDERSRAFSIFAHCLRGQMDRETAARAHSLIKVFAQGLRVKR